MDIKFPEEENPFPKTMAKAIVSVIVALLIGMFLGSGLGALFGTDDSVLVTSDFTDRMSAARTLFTDGDQLESFSKTALRFQDMDGLKLYSKRNHDGFVALWNGEYVDACELFADDEDLCLCLKELLRTQEVLEGVETTGGSPIDDMQMYNIAVSDGVVYYYLYYAEAGYVGLAYDSTHTTLTDAKDDALSLTVTESGVKEWFITYLMED